ncbi:MAG TPA: divalent-cation tolerance protein CutA [Candidatus Saccharimonadales bacterium]|jgi:periplasmic divalent cation tolerance protein
MTKRKFVELILTCVDRAEAQRIASALLNKRLINCAKLVPVESMFWWQGKIESEKEMLLIMESAEDLFDEVETEIAKLHSYDTFVLQAIPARRSSQGALKWLNEELKHG